MGWEFEHWDNGKLYLHNDRWAEFKARIEKEGAYPHNWDHRRIFFHLHTPRKSLDDVPAPGDKDLKYKIEDVDNSWSVIYEPYPAFTRTEYDPEGWLPSWHIWAEDKHTDGEQISILTTGSIDADPSDSLLISFSLRQRRKNVFALFRGQFWKLTEYQEYGIGPNAPPKKTKKKTPRRSIFDSFEESW